MRASTLALAGSTRRSADPSVDDHLGEQLLRSDKDRAEQAIVARRIERALRPHSVWVAAAQEPVIVKMANIQHLASPIRAQLRKPLGAVRLAGLLHPTPAVGGEPFACRRAADPGARGPRPRLVRGTGRVDGHQRGRRVLRRPALRAAQRTGCPLLCGRRGRARLRSGGRARRDRCEARGAAAGPRGLSVLAPSRPQNPGWRAATRSPMLTPSGSVSGEIGMSARARVASWTRLGQSHEWEGLVHARKQEHGPGAGAAAAAGSTSCWGSSASL